MNLLFISKENLLFEENLRFSIFIFLKFKFNNFIIEEFKLDRLFFMSPLNKNTSFFLLMFNSCEITEFIAVVYKRKNDFWVYYFY